MTEDKKSFTDEQVKIFVNSLCEEIKRLNDEIENTSNSMHEQFSLAVDGAHSWREKHEKAERKIADLNQVIDDLHRSAKRMQTERDETVENLQDIVDDQASEIERLRKLL